MPEPGSHAYDVKRTRLRAEYDDTGTPDQHADHAANERLQQEHPPRRHGDEREGGPAGTRGDSRGAPTVDDPVHAPGGIVLRSPAFADHAPIAGKHARDGGNVPPPLEWPQVPEDAAELALLCEDPDAPGGTFVHWVVTGIPVDTSGIDESGLPEGAKAGRNDFGESGWGGPRPPVGDEAHRYFFRLYAVDRPLELGPDATGPEVKAMAESRQIAAGTLVGLFAR